MLYCILRRLLSLFFNPTLRHQKNVHNLTQTINVKTPDWGGGCGWGKGLTIWKKNSFLKGGKAEKEKLLLYCTKFTIFIVLILQLIRTVNASLILTSDFNISSCHDCIVSYKVYITI